MDIAICLNNDYVMPSGIMMTSVCENNTDQAIIFHIVSTDITEDGKKDLSDIAEKYNSKIYFYSIDDSITSNLPVGKKWQSYHMQSVASYYRLFLSSVLPEEISKVIYLDGDIIVKGSLKDLWDTDMKDLGLAAVPDVLFCKDYHTKRLEYPQSMGYFNAGVLLLGLNYWRKNQIEKLCLDYVKSSEEKLICHDQDVLNWVFKDRKILLDLKYNVQQDFLYSSKHQKLGSEFAEQLEYAQKNPLIIHYIYGIKPWYKECLHPYRREFLKYKAMSKWSRQALRRYFDGSSRKKDIIHKFLYWFKNSPKRRWAI